LLNRNAHDPNTVLTASAYVSAKLWQPQLSHDVSVSLEIHGAGGGGAGGDGVGDDDWFVRVVAGMLVVGGSGGRMDEEDGVDDDDDKREENEENGLDSGYDTSQAMWLHSRKLSLQFSQLMPQLSVSKVRGG
jgi:hypothetical protein